MSVGGGKFLRRKERAGAVRRAASVRGGEGDGLGGSSAIYILKKYTVISCFKSSLTTSGRGAVCTVQESVSRRMLAPWGFWANAEPKGGLHPLANAAACVSHPAEAGVPAPGRLLQPDSGQDPPR